MTVREQELGDVVESSLKMSAHCGVAVNMETGASRKRTEDQMASIVMSLYNYGVVAFGIM